MASRFGVPFCCQNLIMDGTTIMVAFISGLFGGGLTSWIAFTRAQKADREKWEKWRRGGYGLLLNRIDEYRHVGQDGVAEWQRSYRDARARVLLSGSKKVSRLLMQDPLLDPPDPGGDRELLPFDAHTVLVEAMRLDVVPKSQSPRGSAFA